MRSLRGREDLQPGVEHGLRKVPVDLSLGGYGDCGNCQIHLFGTSRLQQVLDRRFDDELRLSVKLAADLLQSSMLKPVSARFSSKTNGLIIRVATRSLWSVGWENAKVGARHINKIAMRPIVEISLSNKIVD